MNASRVRLRWPSAVTSTSSSMRMPPNGSEPLDHRAVEPRFVLREQRAQQRRNEIEPRLDRDDDAGLQRAREPQVRVLRRRLALAYRPHRPAGRPRRAPADRAGARARAAGSARVMPVATASSALHFTILCSRSTAGELPMREHVQHDEVDAGLHLVADALLERVHRRDQRREVVGRRRRVRARDVGGVAVELRSRVDQQRALDGRRRRAQVLVVQRRGVLVQAR